MSVEVGQRWVFKGGHGSFIGEVENITDIDRHDMRVVDIINWPHQSVGYLYSRCNVFDGSWTLLEGQDRPKN